MDLLSTARALDDQYFVWRVKAACLTYASENIATLSGNELYMAQTVMLRPHDVDTSMLGHVATDNAVAAAIIITDGSTVDTKAVDDADIFRVVSEKWKDASSNYTTSPVRQVAQP